MKKHMTKSIFSLTASLLISGGLLGSPVFAAELPAAASVKNETVRSGLNQTRIKYSGETAFGAERKTGFTEIDNNTYYLDANGEKVTGLLETGSGTYYFNEDGTMAEGFVKNGEDTLYFDHETGRLQTGTIEEEGKTYILDEQGKTQSGWVQEEQGTFYLNEDGSVVKNEVRTIDDHRYSFSEQGVMETNVTRGNYVYDAQGIGTADAGAYERIAQAALAQLGVAQDCTMLVTNSLKAVGINFHGAPESYLSLGEMTDNPVPGDIIVYSGHVAIYIGDGQAVHGGWNGYTTEIFSVNCSAPLIGFVHPRLPE